MQDDKSARLVVDIAQALASLIRGLDPSWAKAYLRFFREPGQSQIKASYISDNRVSIVSVMAQRDFFSFAEQKCEALIASVGKERGVILVWVDSNFEYEVLFEYEDMNRWGISKMDGGTGIPVGLDE